jgi:phosphoenolpyruvate synthase/pyruvate phosphate dikinase
MVQSGILVPEGFVILSSAFDKFIEKSGLNIEIEAALSAEEL